MKLAYLARDIAARMNHAPVYLSARHSADLIQDISEIANTDLESIRVRFDAAKTDLVTAYGFQPVADPSSKPFAFSNGAAIIPIHGVLVNRLSWGSSYVTGYNFIRAQRNAALDDPDVKMLIYDVNSPGGTCAGCSELAQEMYDTRNVKPSLSVVDSSAYSAAYFLASSADKMVATPSSGVGSIGTLLMHVDISGMLEKDGIKITFIDEPEGGEKVDGNPYEPLSDRALKSMREGVAYHYGLFTGAVARNRDMAETDVVNTKAATFNAPDALELGLIDDIASPADAISKFADSVSQSGGAVGAAAGSTNEGILDMDEKELQAKIDAGINAGLAKAKERSTAIRGSEEAKGRETLAAHLADGTDLPVEAAVAILKAAPKETAAPAATAAAAAAAAAAAGNSRFHHAMENTRNPNVGSDTAAGVGNDGAAPTAAEQAGGILKIFSRATGKKIGESAAA